MQDQIDNMTEYISKFDLNNSTYQSEYNSTDI